MFSHIYIDMKKETPQENHGVLRRIIPLQCEYQIISDTLLYLGESKRYYKFKLDCVSFEVIHSNNMVNPTC